MSLSPCTGNLHFLLIPLFSERSCGHSLTINRQQRGLHCEQDTNVPSMHVCSQRPHQICHWLLMGKETVLWYAQATNCHVNIVQWADETISVVSFGFVMSLDLYPNRTDKITPHQLPVWLQTGIMIWGSYSAGGWGVSTKVEVQHVKGKMLRVELRV